MIITARELRNQKLERLRSGQNAYTESNEVIRLLQRDIANENLDVLVERTSSGCWFVPADNNSRSTLTSQEYDPYCD